MSNPSRRGQVGSEVSSSMQGADFTPFVNTHFNLPYGLRLQQTINAGTTSVTIPDGITFVYAIAVGGGGGATQNNAGGAGGVAWGWTIASPYCVVGAGGVSSTAGGFTRYGNVMAGGGGQGGPRGSR